MSYEDRTSDLTLTVGSTAIPLVIIQDQNGAKMFRRFYSPKFGQRVATEEDLSYATSPLEEEFVMQQSSWHLGLFDSEVEEQSVGEHSLFHKKYSDATGIEASIPGKLFACPSANVSSVGAGALASTPAIVLDFAGKILSLSTGGTDVSQTSDGGANWTKVGDTPANPTGAVVHNNLVYVAYGSNTAYQYTGTAGALTIAGLVSSNRTGEDSQANLFAVSQDYSTGEQVLWKANNPNRLFFSPSGINGGTAWSTVEIVGPAGSGTGADKFTAVIPYSDGLIIGKSQWLYFRDNQTNIYPIAGPFLKTTYDNFSVWSIFNNRVYLRVEDRGIIEVSRSGAGWTVVRRNIRNGLESSQTPSGEDIVWLDADQEWLYVVGKDTTGTSGFYKGKFYDEPSGSVWVWHGSFLLRTGSTNDRSILHPVMVSGVKYWTTWGVAKGSYYKAYSDPTQNVDSTFETGQTVIYSPYWNLHQPEVWKLAGSFSLAAHGLSASNTVRFDYLRDAEALSGITTLTTINANPSAPSAVVQFPAGKSFQRMRNRLILTNGTTSTPIVVHSYAIRGDLRPIRRARWDFYARLEGNVQYLSGGHQPLSVESVFLQLFDPASLAGAIYQTGTLVLTENFLGGSTYSASIEDAEVVFVKEANSKELVAAIHLVLKQVFGSTT